MRLRKIIYTESAELSRGNSVGRGRLEQEGKGAAQNRTPEIQATFARQDGAARTAFEQARRGASEVAGTEAGRGNAVRLEKKRILKEDGRYLLFYHSAATASAEQTEVFTEVSAEAVALVAPKVGATSSAPQNKIPGRESADV